MAAIPPDRLRTLTRGEAGILDHGGEARLVGEAADRFDQIAIGLAVADNQVADRRDHLEREEVVDAVEPGHVAGGEFQAHEAPAGLQHAEGLLERLLDARHVADAEGDGHRVIAAVGEGRQFLGVGLDEAEPVGIGAPLGALLANRQHLLVDVGNRHQRRLGAVGDAEGDVAGAAGHVEHAEGDGRAPGRRQPGDEGVLPQAVDAARHEVVHQVVAAGDRVENVVDQPLLVCRLDLAEAE